MTPAPELVAYLSRVRQIAFVSALAGGALCVLGYAMLRDQFYAAYLTAFLYWLEIGLGCLAISMLHGMTGGAWGQMIRRIIEAGYETVPLMAVLFIPLWLGVGTIYEWADPEVVQHHEVLIRKAGYLNVAGFQIRVVVYFAIWVVITWALNWYTPNADPQADTPRTRHLQQASGMGFIAYGFTFTLAAVDWVMSLEPEWYSTMYGLIHIAGQGVSGISFAVLVVVALRRFEPWSRTVTPSRLKDLSSLLFASVMFWAYVSYFQYLVIWSGNLPEENVWYVRRLQGGWQYLALTLLLFHFIVPFSLLLSRSVKRDATKLFRIAAMLLVMEYVDLYWMVIPGIGRPSTGYKSLTFHWLDVAALMAIGGLWISLFVTRLLQRVRLPIYDPEILEQADD